MAIHVSVESFPALSAVPNGQATVGCSLDQLVGFSLICGRSWAAGKLNPWQYRPGGPVTPAVGAPAIADLLAYASNEARELGGQAQRLGAYLEVDAQGLLRGTEYLRLLEKTEKGQAAALLGAGLAGFFAWSELGIPALTHVSLVEAAGGLRARASSGNSRPDYVGRPKHGARYSVIEAKGTTGRDFGPTAVCDAKRQAKSISTVARMPVLHTAVSIARVTDHEVRGRLIDPKPEPDGASLSQKGVDVQELAHYGPIMRAKATDTPTEWHESADLGGVTFHPMGSFGYFGVLPEIDAALSRLMSEANVDPSEARGEIERARTTLVDRVSHLLPKGRDGARAEGSASASETPTDLVFTDGDGRGHTIVPLPDGHVFAFPRT